MESEWSPLHNSIHSVTHNANYSTYSVVILIKTKSEGRNSSSKRFSLSSQLEDTTTRSRKRFQSEDKYSHGGVVEATGG